MRKLHWVSMVLLAAPIAFASACGGDDTSGGGTGGSTGTGGATGTGGSDTGGSGTGGGDTGGSTGTGGSDTGGSTGTGGTTDEGGTGGAATDDGGTGGSTTDDGGNHTEGGAALVCPDTYEQEVARGATCQDYCDCMTGTCDTKFADNDACMTACMAITVDQLCCRTYHCNNAKGGNAELHCNHAVGMAGQCG